MRLERLTLEGEPARLAAEVRSLVPAPESVRPAVEQIVSGVREGGDEAVREFTSRFDPASGGGWPLRVDPLELEAGLEGIAREVREGLELAAGNVRAVALASVEPDREVRLPQGHRIVLRDVPVRRAGVYVPGGRAPYPSTVVMGVVTAQAAGVQEVAVCSPPGPDGEVAPAILAACALCGVDELYRVGGAQAVAALAYGTESISAVDVIVGPGNLHVQEAKRLVTDRVGIDGFNGPTDLLVLIEDDPSGPATPALDLLAQAEHGADSLVVAVSSAEAVLDGLEGELRSPGSRRDVAEGDLGPIVLVQAPDAEAALAFAEAFAPEHLQLVGAAAEALADRVRSAGCVFVGPAAGTAFGDYVCGSTHVLPTGGAARFASGLSPRHFRRRMSEVHQDAEAAASLAPAGAAIARAEGFELHARSMEARMQDNDRP